MKAGDAAPNFVLIDQDGNPFELFKIQDKKILLVFYPKDGTPVCSRQLGMYNENLELFDKYKIRLVGISTDPVESHLGFYSELRLNFPLLSDSDKTVSRKYKAVNFLGSVKRKLVLIGTDKKILWTADTLSVNYLKPEQILNLVKPLQL